jgi:trimethylamine---corrinoid protein Co-methyltransferase
MQTRLQVLSDDERWQIHDQSLRVLERTGVRVDTAPGRRFLGDAGAMVDEARAVVRLPRALVEEALRLAPTHFSLGARRPGWDLPMNAGECTLLVDGEAMFVRDRQTGRHRPGTRKDWLEATRLIDALDEVGVYWQMLEAGDQGHGVAGFAAYLDAVLTNFSKHIQDSIPAPEYAPCLLQMLEAVFGSRETVRQRHPFSFLLCPQSPLIIEGPRTDAYLATLGWDIPVAVMPMPIMGTTAPASLVATTVLGNCEVLAMLCLIQAATPGTAVIYAPALSVMNPRTAAYGGGPIEHGLLGAACVEMARHYGLPAEASGIGTDAHEPGLQAGYERALNGLLPAIAWPDILVGPGLLGGSMTLCLEQLLVDVEMFRMFKRARQGIDTGAGRWLEDEIAQVGPGGHFAAQRSTVRATRDGEWYLSRLGVHDTYSGWLAAGQPRLLDEARGQVEAILAAHEPLPLEEDVRRELARIRMRAA